mgnify:CR=1 FL=1
MSAIGRSINVGFVLLIVLALAGTAGATVLYQSSTGELQDRNQELQTENEELRTELNETETEYQQTRTRVDELESQLNTRNEDVDQVADELRRTERQLQAAEDELATIVERVKRLGDRDKRVTDADLLAIAEDVQGRERERHVELLDLTAASGGGTPTASVRLRIGDRERVASGTGSGPVDAAIKAVKAALGSDADAQLDSYHVDAITGGTDAVVTVEVEMSKGDRSVTVATSDSDITRCSVDAMVEALDRLLGAEAVEKEAQPEDATLADD